MKLGEFLVKFYDVPSLDSGDMADIMRVHRMFNVIHGKIDHLQMGSSIEAFMLAKRLVTEKHLFGGKPLKGVTLEIILQKGVVCHNHHYQLHGSKISVSHWVECWDRESHWRNMPYQSLSFNKATQTIGY